MSILTELTILAVVIGAFALGIIFLLVAYDEDK